ncbi:FkbM family methyltransferase [Pseudorhodobacter sp. W20_MBD10_FR17]|uniref:FkbM family methyltransferase n=1 Tax=Pseudorhodobacter sp. W20_MBD10_FR17 TaxID=3240266 RepID=UPI003F9CD269
MPKPPAPLPDHALAASLAGLRDTMDEMLKVMNAQLHLQRVALLEDGHILRFNTADMKRIVMSLPDAADDFVQGVIVQTRGFYEAKILSRVQALGLVGPQSLVCDIGANIGNQTVFFGVLMGAGRVIAFEPQAHCFATLRKNITLNGLEGRVQAHQVLVGAATGMGAMTAFNIRNLGGTSFAADPTGTVPMVARDAVLTPDDVAMLDLLKVDVEGMQMSVLQGAAGILAARKPEIWVELLQRDDAFAETADYLAGFGYVAERLARNDFLFRVPA